MPSSRPGEVRDEEDLCGEGDVDEPDHLGHKSLVKGVGRLVSRARHGLFSPRRAAGRACQSCVRSPKPACGVGLGRRGDQVEVIRNDGERLKDLLRRLVDDLPAE